MCIVVKGITVILDYKGHNNKCYERHNILYIVTNGITSIVEKGITVTLDYKWHNN